MIIIADSGLTKTDWRIVFQDRTIFPFETKGLSPFFSNSDDYYSALTSSFPPEIKASEVSKVFFYGSGCAGEEKGAFARQSLQAFFANAQISVYSDLLAAARALFGDGKGVIAILGTGSNIGYFDGTVVKHYTPSLGFILGDEGSGAYIGRRLIQSYFYNELPSELSEAFKNKYNLNLSDILDRIYCQQKPSTYLASFVPFVKENILNVKMQKMVSEVFENLYEFHLKKIPELKDYGLGTVGSVGFIFNEFLNKIALEKGFSIAKIIQYPIDSLVDYHIIKES